MRRRGLARCAGLITALACMFMGTVSFANGSHYYYDAQGRLIGVTTNSSQVGSYVYDSADNRSSLQKYYPAPPQNSQSMAQNNYLFREQALVSADGRFSLTLQVDGNLVLYGSSGALWALNPTNNQGAMLVMQGDGNLVLYDIQSHPIWSASTSNNPNSTLVLQTDGNLVIYNQANAAVWSTGTGGH